MTLSRSLAILGLLFAFTAPAHAQDAATSQTGEFWISIYDPANSEDVRLKDPTETSLFFNSARCNCDSTIKVQIEQNPNNYTALSTLNALLSANGKDGIGKLYVANQGANCVDVEGSPSRLSCTNLLDPNDDSASFKLTDFVSKQFWSANISVQRLFSSSAGCGQVTSARQIIFYYAADDVLATAKSITFNLTMDTTPPSAPTGLTVRGGNGSLKVEWDKSAATSDTSLQGFLIFCRNSADGLPAKDLGTKKLCSTTVLPYCYDTPQMECADSAVTTGDGLQDYNLLYRCSDLISPSIRETTIRDLANNVSYDVTIAAIDRSGNISDYAGVVSGTPVPTVDFFTDYETQGGLAKGGCSLGTSTTPGGFMVLGIALLGLLTFRRGRRRGKSTLTLVLLASTLGANTAQAQAVFHEDAFNSAPESKPWTGTPRNYAIELRWGPYRPDVDSEFGDKADAPYAKNFGTKKQAMWQLEFDWEVLQVFGTLSAGVQAGYFKVSGKACLANAFNDDGTCVKSGDNTSLNLYPFAALLVYRFDELANRFSIPLVPYVKLGLNYILWTAKDDAGNTVTTPSGEKGRGATTGWQSTLGISLRLDFLDPSAARAFDGDMGVNHTYAFFELTNVKAHGLGGGNSLRVGDSTWFGGLMFEF